MQQIYLDYLLPAAVIGALAGFLLFLYVCNDICLALQDRHPEWLDNYLGDKRDVLWEETRALYIAPSLLRDRLVHEMPEVALQKRCRLARYIGWFWIACLLVIVLPALVGALRARG